VPLLDKPVTESSAFRRINYGCGYDKRDGYLNVDVDPACQPDVLIPAGDLSSLPKRHFQEVLAKDVLEHIPRSKTLDALLEFSSLLHDDGTLIVQTSSITQIAKKLADNPSFSDQYGWTICLFGNQAHPGDYHFTGFTDTTLNVHLAAAGFEIVSRAIIDEWMPRIECRKLFAWDDLATDNCADVEFLQFAYRRFFDRDLDDIGRIHFGEQLRMAVTRRAVLKAIASSPERLFVTARQLGL